MSDSASRGDYQHHGPKGLADALNTIAGSVRGASDVRHKFKIVRVVKERHNAWGETVVRLELGGRTKHEAIQYHAQWRCRWQPDDNAILKLVELELLDCEEVVLTTAGGRLFHECTTYAMHNVAAYRTQFSQGAHYWSNHVERRLGSDLMGNHGIAVGDVDGDLLDDIYLCQPGGLPDRLLIQQSDGTLRDASAEMGVNFYDSSRSVLMLDLDNDGDQDLAVATITGLLLLENMEHRQFTVRQQVRSVAAAYTLAAADYDGDRYLDILCLSLPC